MQKTNEFLHDGFYYDDHENYLIGNADGLRKLQDTIDSAIRFGEDKAEIGEFFSKDGDYIGIRCLADEFFLETPKAGEAGGCKKTTIRVVIFSVIFLLVPYLFGLYALFQYVMNSF